MAGTATQISITQEKTMRIKLWLPIVLALSAFAAGCNTMEGAGKDIERGGEKIQDAADRNK